MSILNKQISYFPSTTDTRKGISVNLLMLLQSTKHKDLITTLRSEPDLEKQGKIKEDLPCYTVTGTFSRRCEEGLLLPSGLAAVDLDSAEDYDVIPLLHELKKIPYIAYAGLSCRGKRIFAIIPFLHPEKYNKQYERLIKSFEDIGLPMGDTCHKTISQPRYISYNTKETCFYNHNAKHYHLLPPEKTYYNVQPRNTLSNNKPHAIPDNPFNWCETYIQKSHSFEEGGRHKYIIALARYCNIKGIPQSDTLSGCIANYNTDGFEESEISKIVKHIYSSHSESHNSKPFKPISKTKNSKHKKHKNQPAKFTPFSLPSISPSPTLPISQAFSVPPSLSPSVAQSPPLPISHSFSIAQSPTLPITPPFIPPPLSVHRHDYIGPDNLLHIHYPGLPEII